VAGRRRRVRRGPCPRGAEGRDTRAQRPVVITSPWEPGLEPDVHHGSEGALALGSWGRCGSDPLTVPRLLQSFRARCSLVSSLRVFPGRKACAIRRGHLALLVSLRSDTRTRQHRSETGSRSSTCCPSTPASGSTASSGGLRRPIRTRGSRPITSLQKRSEKPCNRKNPSELAERIEPVHQVEAPRRRAPQVSNGLGARSLPSKLRNVSVTLGRSLGSNPHCVRR
jgi:hypothetical protein